jgi:hypothetical protein
MDYLLQLWMHAVQYLHNDQTLPFKWQTLIGAAIGAAAPFSLWFVSSWWELRRERTESRYNLTKLVGLNMMSAVGARHIVKAFLNEKIPFALKMLHDYPDKKHLGLLFFPMFSAHPIALDPRFINSGSGYIDVLMLEVLRVSNDFAFAIDDMRRQFETMIQQQRELTFAGLGSTQELNDNFKINLENFKKVAQRDLIETNTKMYVRLLASVQVAIRKLNDIGLIRWRWKYRSNFRVFKNKEAFHAYMKNPHEFIAESLRPALDERIKLLANELQVPLSELELSKAEEALA